MDKNVPEKELAFDPRFNIVDEQPKKKFGFKFFASLFTVVTLLSVVTTVGLLSSQSQDFRSKASTTGEKNVLVFMVDDLDSNSFNLLLSKDKLPNIKKYIVDKGVTFENSFVTESICCSSRASFLSGKYSHNTGVFNVVGAESGEKAFGANKDNNLAVWMKNAGYTNSMIGKYMNLPYEDYGARPGWNNWIGIMGYDARPGMYAVAQNTYKDFNSLIYPDLYQEKYVAETANKFISQTPSKFFAYINPHSPHIDLPNWVIDPNFRDNVSANNVTIPVVGLSHYRPTSGATRIRSLLKGPIDAANNYQLFTSTQLGVMDAKGNPTWSAWTVRQLSSMEIFGDKIKNVISYNIFNHPAVPGGYREQAIAGPANNQEVWSRDVKSGVVGTWTLVGLAKDILKDTGTKPIISFSATDFPNGGVSQNILRGSEVDGYDLYIRALVGGSWSPWELMPDQWQANTSADKIRYMATSHEGNGMLRLWLVRNTLDNKNLTLLGRNINSFYRLTQPVGNQAVVDTVAPNIFFDEGSLFGADDKSGVTKNITTIENPYVLHPYYSGRVYADGNWPNLKTYQSFSPELYPDKKLPAGSLRAGGDKNGFDPIAGFENPILIKSMFNNNDANKDPQRLANNNWPDIVNTKSEGGKTILQYLNRQYLDRLESMISVDVMVGEVMKKVESLGKMDDTLVIFTSDNGYFLGDYRLGNKVLPYENSLRVPLIIKPPVSLTAGKVNRNTVLNIDLAPTILNYVGIDWVNGTLPDGKTAFNIDGRSLKPLIESNLDLVADWRSKFLVEYRYPRAIAGQDTKSKDVDLPLWQWGWAIPDMVALRTGLEATPEEGKNTLYLNITKDPLIAANAPFFELYDMKSDPNQMTNLYSNSAKTINPSYANLFTKVKNYVSALATCKGQTCRDLDKAPVAPPPAREALCISASSNGQINGDPAIPVGGKLTLAINAKATDSQGNPVTSYNYTVNNRDNIISATGVPNSVCEAGPGYQGDCPAGSHIKFVIADATKGTIDVNYADLFVTDVRTGKVATRLQFNAYVKPTGGQTSLPAPSCITFAHAGVTATREDLCISASSNGVKNGDPGIQVGGKLSLSMATKTTDSLGRPMQNYNYTVYDRDNINSTTGGDTSICVAGPGYQGDCPAGSHLMIIVADSTKGSIDVNYADLFVTDVRTGKVPKRLRFGAYVTPKDGATSLGNMNCSTYAHMTQREALCTSVSIDGVVSGTSTVSPGGKISLSMVTKPTDSLGYPLVNYNYTVYNRDNPGTGGAPLSVCEAGPGYQGDCPAGSHIKFVIADATKGAADVNYADLFVTDVRTAKVATRLQFNGYVTPKDGATSLYSNQCVVYAQAK